MAAEPFSTSANVKTEGTTIDTSAANLSGDSYLSGGFVYSSSSGSFTTDKDNLPVGIIRMWIKEEANATPPDSYLVCAGQEVSTTTYAKLHSVIGYRFGGSGAVFNLPRFNVTSGNTYRVPSGVVSTEAESSELNNVNSIGTGANSDLSHTHQISTFTYSSTAGNSANVLHAHASSSQTTANHTHTMEEGRLTSNAAHTHNFGGADANHTHSYLDSGAVNASTTNPNSTHRHNDSGGTAESHAHNSSNVTHSHTWGTTTFNADTGHSHGFSATFSSQSLAHTHTVPAIGTYFIVKYR